MSKQEVTIYADFAGQPNDDAQSSQTYVTLLCNSKEYAEVNYKCGLLRQSLRKHDIDVDNAEFEFHTGDIYWGNGFMLPLAHDKETRYKIMDKLRTIIKSCDLRYVLVKIDKPEGVLSLDIFAEDIQRVVESQTGKIPPPVIERLNGLIDERFGGKNFGSMGTCYHLLLGATSGLLHWDGFREQANLIVDRQFVNDMDMLNFVLALGGYTWPLIKESTDFSKWPHNGKPDWHIKANAIEEESYAEYGIQLADYLAYTFKRIGKPLFDDKRFCTTTNLMHFNDSPGMYFKVQDYSKSRRVPYYPNIHTHNNNQYFNPKI